MRERKSSISLGVLFWVAAILLVLVIFLFNRKNIERVMESTGFVEVINQRIGIDSPQQNDDLPPLVQEPQASVEEPSIITLPTEPAASREEPAQAQEPEAVADDPAPDSEAVPAENTAESEEVETRSRDYFIHLVHLNNDGKISLEAVKRSVDFISSPLTATLKSLIGEPGETDGYRNIIPSNTVLNRVWIKGGIAYIDLSEEFSFNPIGLEGYRLQVQQIIATATQFSSVNAVQILIDGEQISFLGGDGLFIGQPLTPSDM